MQRLFVALDLPDDLAQQVADLQDPAASDVRWTRPGQFHLTLRFLGDTPPDQRDALIAGLEAVQHAPFHLELHGAGVFPSKRRPRVLWVGVRRAGPVQRLQAKVETAAQGAGFPAEGKPFHPHVTLGRIKRPDPRWTRTFLRDRADATFEPFRVEAFTLYASTLHPEGAVHEPLARFPLAD